MGITNGNASFLAKAKKAGVVFGRVLTIGHLDRYVRQATLERIASYLGIDFDIGAVLRDPFADSFFRAVLGAETVSSLDYNDYEGCDIVHDMNTPVAQEQQGQFDVVIDGGSLEHIFNVPVALNNCMQMVKPGGSLFVFTMANNHAGHGLYQLGPDFFYAALQPQYGFRVKEMVLEEHPYLAPEIGCGHRYYSVAPRESVKGRISFVSRRPVTIMVHAERIGEATGFTPFPIQQSYLETYQKAVAPEKVAPAPGRRRTGIMALARSIASRMRKMLPETTQSWLEGNRQLRKFALKDSGFFRAIQLP